MAALVATAAGMALAWLARAGGPYRSGPWPGLTARGGCVLLACALLLGAGELAFARALLPLVVVSVGAVLVATLVTRVPGAASAVCGAYLLPRALVSLLQPDFEVPPLLLVPAMAFDAVVWLRAGDLRWRRRRRDRRSRLVVPWRLALASAVFTGLLVIFESARQVQDGY